MNPRYLTKSRFKLALECPTKLYYDSNPEYANRKVEDSFLLALAEGGFQVAELAKCYFPDGHEIKTRDYDESVCQTNELLKLDNVIIFEAAVRHENLFARIDILIKQKNQIELIEVKAKSFNSETDEFLGKKGSILSDWRPYLFDVAFQKHVFMSAFAEYYVSAYLMMADKNAVCPTDGLNQKFKIGKGSNGEKSVIVSPSLVQEDLSKKILIKVNVDSCCDQFIIANLEKIPKDIVLLNI